MKKNAFFSALMITICCASSGLFFSSCQKDETIATPSATISTRTPAPDVPAVLEVPDGYEVSFHTYAQGYQIYVCQETAPGVYQWIFKEPSATLFKNAGFSGVVGTHYGGPTWESNSGSKVKAARIEGVTVDADAIQWLLLGSVSSQGPGIFSGTTHIQRVNTVGGLAPAEGANAATVGQQIEIPYTAEYYFYKAE